MLQYKYLYKILKNIGFIVCLYNKGVFIHLSKQIVFICHIDNIIVLRPNKDYINNIVNIINKDVKLNF